ncbi:uncharacterized protein [Nicotiana tomentosiformis]|uniref:uncharacterized protein n=1 Tax=Nicotiana tomentosiformis TaxID=4098 RepID=UPI00388CC292
MKSFIVKTDERLDAHGSAIKELGSGLRNLEKQVGQIASVLSERIPGTLPADTERNPKETVDVVTLRSEQIVKDPIPAQKKNVPEKESGEQLKNEFDKKKKGKKGAEKKKKEETSRREESNEKVLSQMPAYVKFLKEILAKKRKIEETSLVKLTKHCSTILQNKLPQKCGDPESFTIPCSLGTLDFDKSLCDSGASINLMPLSIYRKLENELGEISSVPISLQLMKENQEVPLILGRPFLATVRAILDIHDRKLMLRVGKETMTFKMNVEMGVRKEKPAASVE